MLRSSPRFDYKWIKCDIQVLARQYVIKYAPTLWMDFYTGGFHGWRTCEVVERDCERWRDWRQPGGEKWLRGDQSSASFPTNGTRVGLGIRTRPGTFWGSHPWANTRAVRYAEPRELPNTIYSTDEATSCNSGTIFHLPCKKGHRWPQTWWPRHHCFKQQKENCFCSSRVSDYFFKT